MFLNACSFFGDGHLFFMPVRFDMSIASGSSIVVSLLLRIYPYSAFTEADKNCANTEKRHINLQRRHDFR